MTFADESKKETEQKRDAYRKILLCWKTALKNSHLYALDHPSLALSCQMMLAAINEALQNKSEVSIVQTDGLFVIEEMLFVEESLLMYDMLHQLEELKINYVVFLSGIMESEIFSLIQFLKNAKPDQVPAPSFRSDHIRLHKFSDSQKLETQKSRKWRQLGDTEKIENEWTGLIDRTFTKLFDEQSYSPADLSEPVEILIDCVHRNPSLFSPLICSRNEENILSRHSFHTMVLSIFIGQKLDFSLGNLKLLATASLFHDVGRALLPADFTTNTKLLRENIPLVQLHTRDGAAFLSGVPGLPMVAVRTALEHHLGYDGLGYPQLPTLHKPHFFSQIVGLADFVSWSTLSDAHYHKPKPMHKVIRAVLRRSGSQFNPLLVKLLLPLFGLYPPNTKIELSSGEQAVVIESNIRNIQRPAVSTLTLEGTPEILWLAELPDSSHDLFKSSIVKIKGTEHDFSHLLKLTKQEKDNFTRDQTSTTTSEPNS